jgi:O-antigen biosynthesis protein
VFGPDIDVAMRINRYYTDLKIEIRAHFEDFDNGVMVKPNEKLKIAIIGAISGLKGSKIIADLVKDANKRELEIEYVLIGYSDRSDLHNAVARFHVTGKYEENEIGDLLQKHRPTAIFIPTPLPETYCYTLSIAWRFGLKPMVFDIGAQARRIRAVGGDAGEILPLSFTTKPTELNDWFLQNIKAEATPENKPENKQYQSIIQDYYGFAEVKPAAKKIKKAEVISA